MNTLVVVDSTYGNTDKIAASINEGLSKHHNAKLLRVSEVSIEDVRECELLVMGSPTLGGRPTPGIQGFLDKIPQDALIGKKVAAFDTRFLEEAQNFALRLLMKTIGYAADKIMDNLVKKGGDKVADTNGFIVTGKEGPLKEGEVERAVRWSRELVNQA